MIFKILYNFSDLYLSLFSIIINKKIQKIAKKVILRAGLRGTQSHVAHVGALAYVARMWHDEAFSSLVYSNLLICI